jgi:hypothetical protein
MKTPENPKIVIDTDTLLSGEYSHCLHCRKLILPEHAKVVLGQYVRKRQRFFVLHLSCWVSVHAD